MEQSLKEKKAGTSRSSSLPLLTIPVASNQRLVCATPLIPLQKAKGFVRRKRPAVDLQDRLGLARLRKLCHGAGHHSIPSALMTCTVRQPRTRPNVSTLVRSMISSSLMPTSLGFAFVSQPKSYLSMDPGPQRSTGGWGQRETLLEIRDRHHPANDLPSLVPPWSVW